MHSLVLASSCGVPFTTIDYDIKMGGFMRYMGLGGLCLELSMGLDILGDVARKVAEMKMDYSKMIEGRVREIRGSIMDEAWQVASVMRGLGGSQGTPGRLLRGRQSRLPVP